jgi:hypothetical protein
MRRKRLDSCQATSVEASQKPVWGPGLILDAAGNLYGTTTAGGDLLGGTVFKLKPKADGTWTGRILHTFGKNSQALP